VHEVARHQVNDAEMEFAWTSPVRNTSARRTNPAVTTMPKAIVDGSARAKSNGAEGRLNGSECARRAATGGLEPSPSEMPGFIWSKDDVTEVCRRFA
jgi:hypothetical protein